MKRTTEATPKATLDWLCDGDPAVVWQVERDLLKRSERTWRATRKRVASEGWGRRLLAERAQDGTWGGGLYQPKWTSTFYTLRLLAQLGLPEDDPKGRASCRLLLDEGVKDSGGVSLWSRGWTDTCVTAMLLSMAVHFGVADDPRAERMVRFLLQQQMPDGGWNCHYGSRNRKGATHASFHTTASTLEGLTAYQAAVGQRRDVRKACARGREFFLLHQLYRSSTTGKIIKPSFAMLSFPTYWFFDVLRGLEHFQTANAKRDQRLSKAIDVLLKKRHRDGRWRSENPHSGKTFFRLEPARQGSRINTLRALRVLNWWSR